MIGTEVIPLAYTSDPGVSDHYDACRKITALDPMSTDQNTGEDQILNSQDSNATSVDQINTSEPARIKTGTTDAQLRAIPSTNEYVDEEPDFTQNLLLNVYQSKSSQQCHHKAATWILQRRTIDRRRLLHTNSYPEKGSKVCHTRKEATDSWKKNIRKKLRLSGQEYTSPQSGKKVQNRDVKPPCTNCRYECVSVFSEEDRKKIFDSIWNFGSYERQKDLVCSRVEEKKYRTYLKDNDEQQDKKRIVARTYSLEKSNLSSARSFSEQRWTLEKHI